MTAQKDSSAHQKSLRGLAAADPATRREVARKGGEAISRNREHMAAIGRKGGEAVSRNREHMAAIGRRGGEASHLRHQSGDLSSEMSSHNRESRDEEIRQEDRRDNREIKAV